MTFCVDGEPHSIVLQGEILCQATPDVLYHVHRFAELSKKTKNRRPQLKPKDQLKLRYAPTPYPELNLYMYSTPIKTPRTAPARTCKGECPKTSLSFRSLMDSP